MLTKDTTPLHNAVAVPNNPRRQAIQIVNTLPAPDYAHNFQPNYVDREALVEAVARLLETTPATTAEQIEAFKDDLAHTGLTQGQNQVHIVGTCHERVQLRDPTVDISALIAQPLAEHELVSKAASSALHVQRTAGQSVKPRSNEFQTLDSGLVVPSFYGEGVNGQSAGDRDPDPTRMVAMGLQARDITEGVYESLNAHIPIAHEMLLLAYERAFVRTDELTGKRYLLSADLPWIGVRTNKVNGPHVALLSTVENAVGVKIGTESDEVHIMQLAQALNPSNERGKLVLMLRIGDNLAKTQEILDTIRLHASNAHVLYDIHGVTKDRNGTKIRCVEDIIRQVNMLDMLCRATGLRRDGTHLETTIEDRYECVDTLDELPTHPGMVDPRLNRRQTTRVLTEV